MEPKALKYNPALHITDEAQYTPLMNKAAVTMVRLSWLKLIVAVQQSGHCLDDDIRHIVNEIKHQAHLEGVAAEAVQELDESEDEDE